MSHVCCESHGALSWRPYRYYEYSATWAVATMPNRMRLVSRFTPGQIRVINRDKAVTGKSCVRKKHQSGKALHNQTHIKPPVVNQGQSTSPRRCTGNGQRCQADLPSSPTDRSSVDSKTSPPGPQRPGSGIDATCLGSLVVLLVSSLIAEYSSQVLLRQCQHSRA
jgi:hypothetical protein